MEVTPGEAPEPEGGVAELVGLELLADGVELVLAEEHAPRKATRATAEPTPTNLRQRALVSRMPRRSMRAVADGGSPDLITAPPSSSLASLPCLASAAPAHERPARRTCSSNQNMF